MNMNKKIIVFQRDEFLAGRCAIALRNIMSVNDFAVYIKNEAAFNEVVAGVPQLFITSAFTAGSDEGVDEYVEKIRNKNPNVMIVALSSIKLHGDFDRVIDKCDDVSLAEFVKTCRDFLEGKLEPKHITVAA